MAFEIKSIPQGDSLLITPAPLKDEFGVTVTDLSGWDFKFCAKSSLDLPDAAARITLGRADMRLSGARLAVVVTPDQLAAFAIGQAYYYALKAGSPNGTIQTLEQGIIVTETSALQAFIPSSAPAATVITTEAGAAITTEDGTTIVTG